MNQVKKGARTDGHPLLSSRVDRRLRYRQTDNGCENSESARQYSVISVEDVKRVESAGHGLSATQARAVSNARVAA